MRSLGFTFALAFTFALGFALAFAFGFAFKRFRKVEQAFGSIVPPVQKHIFDEEMAMASTPRIVPFGVSMVAPVIMAFGSQAQKEWFLPRILSSDAWWCQGYSEPGSGSE